MVLQTVKMGDTAGAVETAADQIQWSIPQKARECREWLRFLRLMTDFRPIFSRFSADFQPIFGRFSRFFSGALRCGSSNEFAMKLNFECQNGREMSPLPEYSRIFWSRCSGRAPTKCQFSGQFNDGNNAFHSTYSPFTVKMQHYSSALVVAVLNWTICMN